MDTVISGFKTSAGKSLAHLKSEFSKMQVGMANASLLDSVLVDAYGSSQPIRNVATITIPESRVINIQPWDKAVLKDIDIAIQKADLGINPVNNGEAIILNIPMLTEERRLDLVKMAKKVTEETKVTVRQYRQDAHNAFKKMEQDDELTEDERRDAEKRLQAVVDEENKNIETIFVEKEAQIMKV